MRILSTGFCLRNGPYRKKSNLLFYKRLSVFFKEHFPDIKLAAELEKELLIEDLAKSGSFARSYSVIAKLSNYSDFTAAQLNAIVDAAISNSQIQMIIRDEDVKIFLVSAITGHEKQIDKDNLETLYLLLEPPSKESVDDDFPF
jgi:hypothetical protein